MASGMDMLLKSFGVDPEQIKSAVEGMSKGVIQVNERLGRIEQTQQEILRILKNGHRDESPDTRSEQSAAGDDRKTAG